MITITLQQSSTTPDGRHKTLFTYEGVDYLLTVEDSTYTIYYHNELSDKVLPIDTTGELQSLYQNLQTVSPSTLVSMVENNEYTLTL